MRHIDTLGIGLLLVSGLAVAGTPPAKTYPFMGNGTPAVKTAPAHTSSSHLPAAADPRPGTPTPTFTPEAGQSADLLSALRVREAILTEELKIAKLQAGINKANGNDTVVNATGPGGVRSPAMPVLPAVESVQGVGRKLTAKVVFPDGSTLEVRPGQSLAAGLVVNHIGRDGVSVRTHAGVLPLPTYNSASANTTAPPAQPLMPPLQAAPLPVPQQAMPPSKDSTSTKGEGQGVQPWRL